MSGLLDEYQLSSKDTSMQIVLMGFAFKSKTNIIIRSSHNQIETILTIGLLQLPNQGTN